MIVSLKEGCYFTNGDFLSKEYYYVHTQLLFSMIKISTHLICYDSQNSSPRRALRTLEWGASGSPHMARCRHISAALSSVSSAVSICSGRHPMKSTPRPESAESAVLWEARDIGFRESTNSISDKGDALWCL